MDRFKRLLVVVGVCMLFQLAHHAQAQVTVNWSGTSPTNMGATITGVGTYMQTDFTYTLKNFQLVATPVNGGQSQLNALVDFSCGKWGPNTVTVTANGDYRVFCWAWVTKCGIATYLSSSVKTVTVSGCESDHVQVRPAESFKLAMRLFDLRHQQKHTHIPDPWGQGDLKETLAMTRW
jgi:hypothetical protein